VPLGTMKNQDFSPEADTDKSQENDGELFLFSY
jgi:hypothetical protein